MIEAERLKHARRMTDMATKHKREIMCLAAKYNQTNQLKDKTIKVFNLLIHVLCFITHNSNLTYCNNYYVFAES